MPCRGQPASKIPDIFAFLAWRYIVLFRKSIVMGFSWGLYGVLGGLEARFRLFGPLTRRALSFEKKKRAFLGAIVKQLIKT